MAHAYLLLICLCMVLNRKQASFALKLSGMECYQKKMIASTCIATALIWSSAKPTLAAELSLQEQVKVLKSKQDSVQRVVLQAEDQKLTALEIAYPAGKLVAKGSITLKSQDGQSMPLGFKSASDIDPVYGSEDASLFVLAIGREGPVLAAKKYPLKDLQFPMVFEVVSSDLLPPNTEESWAESANNKDAVALTAIISSSSALAQPQGFERIGVDVSNPITFAGAKIRSTANINVFDKLNLKLYTPKEISLLSTIDTELAKRTSNVVGATPELPGKISDTKAAKTK